MNKNREPEWFSWDTVSLCESHRLEAIALLLNTESRLMKFLFDFSKPRLRCPVDELLQQARSLSHGEQLLVAAAVDIWCKQGKLDFAAALNVLDDTNMSQLIRSVCHLREIREEVMHGLIDDQNGGFCSVCFREFCRVADELCAQIAIGLL